MIEPDAIETLAALAQSSRLRIFRALIAAGPSGLAAGRIADELEIAPTSLSFHLKTLSHCGLIKAANDGRSIVYSADYGRMTDLMDYLTENCCGGKACLPVATARDSADQCDRTSYPSNGETAA